CGADAIAAIGPCYFKPQRVDMLIAFLAEIAAAAPETDFYYYHIPQLNGNNFDMMEFLAKAPSAIPAFRGIKYSAMAVHQFQECKEAVGDRYQIFFGCDEMLTSGLAAGADAAIGSTYNLTPRLYRNIMDAFTRGDVQTARTLQSLSVRMVRLCYRYRGLPAIKAMMRLIGLDCGPIRLPLESLTEEEYLHFAQQTKALGLCEWF
ncbi:MAG: dihydrodipicolinate synthase family protein, partial [Sedimentisphaerales bacterium]|nr:dihydrodipicolinate synthase family protein [Sedimentisphaerales bacterium]